MRHKQFEITMLASLAMSTIAFGTNAQVACLPIDRVIVDGVTLFDASKAKAWIAPFEGKCLGLQDFNRIMEAITTAYVDEGYITSRAYLPEQDLSDGSLEIAVVEGYIEDIQFNGEEDRSWQAVVYPKLEGEVANIREIEQGLDNIREMESFKADMELEAGSETGQSILNISATSEQPWKITYSANNYSQEPMGEYSSTIGFSYDHLLGLNDQWNLSFTKSMSPHPLNWGYDGFGTRAINFDLTIPYGKWENTFALSWSDYYQETPGQFDPIPVDGWSRSQSLSFKRLMHRDQTSKTHLTFSLERSEAENYILDTLIESSSRILTVGKIELSHERPLWKGELKSSFALEKGLKWFGAENYDEMPEAQPNAQFTRYLFSADYERDWQFDNGKLGYNATFSAQHSGDRLYGSQQLSIGGVSTVRGVWSSLAAGNSGFTLRQELSYEMPKLKSNWGGTPTLFTALDYGRIFEDTRYDIKNWEATGGVLGLRFEGGALDLDLSYAKLLNLSDQSALDEHQQSGVWMISVSKEW